MVDENSFNGDFLWTAGGVQILVGRSSIGKLKLASLHFWEGQPLGVCRCLSSIELCTYLYPGYANIIAADGSFKV